MNKIKNKKNEWIKEKENENEWIKENIKKIKTMNEWK